MNDFLDHLFMETGITPEDIGKFKYFTFNVTQEDIDFAIRKNPHHCPIARAINRTLGLPNGSTFVYCGEVFGEITIRLPSVDDPLFFYNSEESREFATRFDKQEPVEPARFTITRCRELNKVEYIEPEED